MKMTPAEQHIAEQSERRDLTSICQRLAKLEDRFAAHEAAARLDRRRFNAMGPGPSVSDIVKQEIDGPVRNLAADIEALKESLEGRVSVIERRAVLFGHAEDERMLRRIGIPEDVIQTVLRGVPDECMPPKQPQQPFDLGAEQRIDWDIVSGKREPDARENLQWTHEEIARFKREWAGSKHAQEVYNRRQSELLARAAADRARGQAYYELFDELHKNGGLRGEVPIKLSQLYMALGQPPRMGVDHAED